MAGTAGRAFLADVAEEHFEELQFLWERRRGALRSPAYRERELIGLEERVQAHLDGLLVIGDAVGDLVAPALAGEDPLPAFAAAFALLRSAVPDAATRVAEAFEAPPDPRRGGLRDALANSPIDALVPRLTGLVASAAEPISAAAAEVLAFHGALQPDARRIERFLAAEAPAVRAAGWRLVAYQGIAPEASWYERGLGDGDALVSGAATDAAAWTNPSALATHCRALAAKPAPEHLPALALFAAIAPPEEYQLVGSVAESAAAGPERFRVVGAFAHPYFVELLIRAMEHPDAATAAAAGAAFTKLTGRDVDSGARATAPVEGKPPANEFEAEFVDDLALPDPDLARRHWQELAPALAHAPRISRGMDVSRQLAREQFAALDMESRWEYCLRLRLFTGWTGTPVVLERFPQRF